MENRYGRLAAWVYDLDKPVGRSFGDIAYYAGRLEGCRGPVLEPAVGNGRLFIPLLELGLDLTGFDASGEMLDRCRAHCRDRGLAPALSCQRFESFDCARRFEAIILPAGSFQLIADFARARATLQRFLAHLAPGGRLIMDIDAAGALIAAKGGVRSWAVAEDELITLTEQPLATDFVAQTTHAFLRYEHWRDGRLAGAELERFSLRWWGVEELVMLLRETGFVDVTVSADYRHRAVPEGTASTITFEAHRPAER
ncbi:class I SAM-dependent methyltransferase (plasmid) [Geminicoccaceae bacterium 1502E]|nr:class I SAM-dependent methyltransferase [Geminicoccaceae bacterium 1502E]